MNDSVCIRLRARSSGYVAAADHAHTTNNNSSNSTAVVSTRISQPKPRGVHKGDMKCRRWSIPTCLADEACDAAAEQPMQRSGFLPSEVVNELHGQVTPAHA
jgi:hypothetical protein